MLQAISVFHNTPAQFLLNSKTVSLITKLLRYIFIYICLDFQKTCLLLQDWQSGSCPTTAQLVGEHPVVGGWLRVLKTWWLSFCMKAHIAIFTNMCFEMEFEFAAPLVMFWWIHFDINMCIYTIYYQYVHLTNRFQVAVRLFSNRSQMMSKCGKNKKVALKAQPDHIWEPIRMPA